MRIGRSRHPQQPGQRRRRRGGGIRWWAILLFIGFLGYYWFSNQQESSFTGRKRLIDSSLQQEAALGLQAYDQILHKSRVVQNGPIVVEVNDIMQRLVRVAPSVEKDLAVKHNVQQRTDWSAFNWEVNVLQSNQANAFCLPGGKMAVYTGIVPIAQNKDALAAIMGHEIAHALLRHGAERMAQQKLVQYGSMAAGVAVGDMSPQQQKMVLGALGAGATYGFLNPYSRDHESEADYLGLMLAAAACYNPRESIGLWERMGQATGGKAPSEFMSTHPSHNTRISQLQQWMPEAEQVYRKYCR